MHFSNVFYVGNKIKNPQKILEKINNGKCYKSYYFVCFREESGPEIVISYLFLQRYFRKQDFEAVAIFRSEDEAFEYIRVLTDFSFKLFNKLDYKAVLNQIGIDEIKLNFEKEGD